MRGRRAHGDARSHHAHAGERRHVAVDAAPGRDQVVALGRHQAAERHGMQVVVAERLPDMALRRVVQLDRPAGARDRVGNARPARTSSTVSCWRPTIQRVWRMPSPP